MRILDKDELTTAEEVLRQHLPKSYKVYGFLHSINKNKENTLQVVVDSWPKFKVIICRPDPQNERALDFSKKVTFFSTDDAALGEMLRDDDAIDWSSYFLIGGVDVRHTQMLKDVAAERRVSHTHNTLVHILYLPHISHLPPPPADSQLESRMAPLHLCHAHLVNSTWKFGGDQKGLRTVQKLISNFPSCCVTDAQGRPLAWMLVYDYCALAMLHTLPEHRGRGYAKALIGSLARRLASEGYPVYCFIEADNAASHRLFRSMGFTEDRSYRAAWFEFNF